MNKKSELLFAVLILLCSFLPCAADIDPILVDKPYPTVFECSPDMFIEVPGIAYISYNLGDRAAEKYFLYFKAEVLYLEEEIWDGIDKSSFLLKHTTSEGSVTQYALNYMMTARESLINEWPTMSDPLFFGWLLPLNLVFDVPKMEKDGWSLIFRPAERGGNAVCEIEIPIEVH